MSNSEESQQTPSGHVPGHWSNDSSVSQIGELRKRMNNSEEVQQTKASAPGHWSKDNPIGTLVELRKPLAMQDNTPSRSEPSESNNSQPSQCPQANEAVSKSSLNVDAKEFVPKAYLAEETQAPPEPEIVVYLRDVMSMITVSPDRYQDLTEPLCENLAPFIKDQVQLNAIVNAIVVQSVTESNFRYHGARLCSDLNKMYGAVFRSSLLRRCSEEHKEACQPTERNRGRVQGFCLLLAELYTQLTIDEDTSIEVLGQALLEVLQCLLTRDPIESVKCVCQVLKLCGSKLDARRTPRMDDIFGTLSVLADLPGLEPNPRFLVRNVLELRRTHWGMCPGPEPIHNHCLSFQQDDPVQYGPDGQVMTEEETNFLQDSIPPSDDIDDYLWDMNREQDEDSMDDEAQQAYEQFLTMNLNNSSN